MYIESVYAQHIRITQEQANVIGPDVDDPTTQSFERLYNLHEEAGTESAKGFLRLLGDEELETIRNYHGLEKPIDIASLGREDAENLIRHADEQIDFDRDGFISLGSSSRLDILPSFAPAHFRDSVMQALDSMNALDPIQNLGSTFDTAMVVRFQYFEIRQTAPMNQSIGHMAQFEGSPFSLESIQSMVAGFENGLEDFGMGFERPGLLTSLNTFSDLFEQSWKTQQINDSALKHGDNSDWFWNKLDHLGAGGYINNMNQEKIEALIEERRERLMEDFGIDVEQVSKSEEMIGVELLEAIETLLAQYREELVERHGMQDQEKVDMMMESSLNRLLQTV